MDRKLQDFEDSVITRNVVARVVMATEFPTDNARKKYLESHPNADPSKHTVRKHKTVTKFRRTDRTRWDNVLKLQDGMKGLVDKARKNDDAEAKAEISKRFTTLTDHGESLAADAKPILQSLKKNKKLSPKAKDYASKLEEALKDWDDVSHKAQKAKGRNTEAQLSSWDRVMDLASKIRTYTHWLQDDAVQSGAIKRKRSSSDWKS